MNSKFNLTQLSFNAYILFFVCAMVLSSCGKENITTTTENLVPELKTNSATTLDEIHASKFQSQPSACSCYFKVSKFTATDTNGNMVEDYLDIIDLVTETPESGGVRCPSGLTPMFAHRNRCDQNFPDVTSLVHQWQPFNCHLAPNQQIKNYVHGRWFEGDDCSTVYPDPLDPHNTNFANYNIPLDFKVKIKCNPIKQFKGGTIEAEANSFYHHEIDIHVDHNIPIFDQEEFSFAINNQCRATGPASDL